VYNATDNTTTAYNIKIVSRDTNEISSPMTAYQAVEWLITNAGAKFIIGGFRTEAVKLMIDNVIATHKIPFFICGAATAELLAGDGVTAWPYGHPNARGTPYYPYNASSDYYKYIFRTTPFNSSFLVCMCLPMLAQLAKQIQDEMGWGWNGTGWNVTRVRMAIFGENLTWAVPIISTWSSIIAGYGSYVGYCLTMVKTLGDNPSAAEVDAALNDIQAAQNHVILTVMSGKIGLTFGQRKGALNITAIPLGINVEGQHPNYGINTAGGAMYEITTGTWAPGVNQTPETAGFLSRYIAYTGAMPIYTASSYDAVYLIKKAIEATDSLDKDVICEWIEDLSNAQVISTGRAGYYPVWDGSTLRVRKASGLTHPALNSSQLAQIYADGWYLPDNTGYNYTMPPYTTHDLIYGPRTDPNDPNRLVNGPSCPVAEARGKLGAGWCLAQGGIRPTGRSSGPSATDHVFAGLCLCGSQLVQRDGVLWYPGDGNTSRVQERVGRVGIPIVECLSRRLDESSQEAPAQPGLPVSGLWAKGLLHGNTSASVRTAKRGYSIALLCL